MAKPKKKQRAQATKAAKKKTGRGRGRPRKSFLKDYAAVGSPPADPLLAAEWTFKVLVVSIDKIRTDPGINERDRTRELRTTAKAMKDLIPASRLAQAERLIREDADRMRHQVDPEAQELTDVTASSIPGGPLATTHRRIRARKR